MKYLIYIISITFFVSCNSQTNKTENSKTKIIILEDSLLINQSYAVFEELKIDNESSEVINKLQKEVQNVSVNGELKSNDPQKRLEIKKKLFSDCFKKDQINECVYSPEGYKIQSENKGIVTIKYSYNQFSSYDQFFKYLTLDLQKNKLLNYDVVFVNPDTILKSFNDDYTKYFQDILDDLDLTKDEDQEEFDIIESHLEQRRPFELKDLNNYEFVFKNNQIEIIRFHYNGMTGAYKSIIPNGYVDYNFLMISDNISNNIKTRFNVEK
ncbi:hypothetical protein [Aquimarina amphilecti]|nr:hypothetical protein [Aquimarina amphilecti]